MRRVPGAHLAEEAPDSRVFPSGAFQAAPRHTSRSKARESPEANALGRSGGQAVEAVRAVVARLDRFHRFWIRSRPAVPFRFLLSGLASLEFANMVTAETIWLAIGVGGQATFGLRMLVQWYASERAGKSVVPPLFWYISLGGSLMMLAYAIWRRDPVFIFGQSLPLPVYVRNVMLILRERRDLAVSTTATTTVTPSATPSAEPPAGLRLADLSREAPSACSCPCLCGARKAA